MNHSEMTDAYLEGYKRGVKERREEQGRGLIEGLVVGGMDILTVAGTGGISGIKDWGRSDAYEAGYLAGRRGDCCDPDGFIEDAEEAARQKEEEELRERMRRERPPNPEPPGSGGSSGSSDDAVFGLVKLGFWLAVIGFVVWLVVVVLMVAVVFAPVWLGAVAVGVIVGYLMAGQVITRLTDETIQEAGVYEEKKGGGTRLRLAEDFFHGLAGTHGVPPWLICATLVFAGAMVAWPLTLVKDDENRLLIVGMGLAAVILGTLAGLKVFRWQLENRVFAKAGGPDATELQAPKAALGLSIPGFLLLVAVWFLQVVPSAILDQMAQNAGIDVGDGDQGAVVEAGNSRYRQTQQEQVGRAQQERQVSQSPRSFDIPGLPRSLTTMPASFSNSSHGGTNNSSPSNGSQKAQVTEDRSQSRQEAVRGFVEQHLQLEKTHDLDRIMDQYADRVTYWSKGVVDQQDIRKDKETYFTRWPITSEELISQIEVATDGEFWSARFKTRFRVVNPVKGTTIEGIQESHIKLKQEADWFKIVLAQGKVVETQKTETSPQLSQSAPAVAASSFPGERYPDTRLRWIQASEVGGMSLDQLRYAINEMFARHGAAFAKREITHHFQQFSWYQPRIGLTYDEIEVGFSEMEKANLKILGAIRDSKMPIRTGR